MPKRIGITGNIGAGKTTVCREFERLGVPVYYADDRAKRLMVEDAMLREAISGRFGQQAYSAGELDRAYLSSQVFGDALALADLNSLVHPVVARDGNSWHQRQTHPYTLHEAAILFEIDAAASYDEVVVVSCPVGERRRRVMGRDQISAAQFAQRAAKQWSDERKEAAADYLITNDGRTLLLPQILVLDRQFRT
ncbi:dephospho-CoA kinase [Neolewinella sp.]|uniref:dephospho-CoA kinase n=1 Tax=Neolewinella sp. TaxID=2993543 RepID=UPI003B51C588